MTKKEYYEKLERLESQSRNIHGAITTIKKLIGYATAQNDMYNQLQELFREAYLKGIEYNRIEFLFKDSIDDFIYILIGLSQKKSKLDIEFNKLHDEKINEA